MSFFGALLGNDAADASKAAAADTYGKQQQAISSLNNYGDQYAGQFSNLAQGYQPYVGAGNSAIQQLMSGLGLGGNSQAFTDAYHNLPGYQAGLNTGTNAITQNQAAHGLLKSGSTLKGLQTFGQNYEDQKSGDYMSRLMGVAGQGQGALGAQNATVGQGLQGQLATRQGAYGGAMNAAGTIGQGDVAAASAQAQGAQNIFNTVANLGGKALGFGMGGFGGPSAYSGVFGSGASSGGNNGGVVWGR